MQKSWFHAMLAKFNIYNCATVTSCNALSIKLHLHKKCFLVDYWAGPEPWSREYSSLFLFQQTNNLLPGVTPFFFKFVVCFYMYTSWCLHVAFMTWLHNILLDSKVLPQLLIHSSYLLCSFKLLKSISLHDSVILWALTYKMLFKRILVLSTKSTARTVSTCLPVNLRVRMQSNW